MVHRLFCTASLVQLHLSERTDNCECIRPTDAVELSDKSWLDATPLHSVLCLWREKSRVGASPVLHHMCTAKCLLVERVSAACQLRQFSYSPQKHKALSFFKTRLLIFYVLLAKELTEMHVVFFLGEMFVELLGIVLHVYQDNLGSTNHFNMRHLAAGSSGLFCCWTNMKWKVEVYGFCCVCCVCYRKPKPFVESACKMGLLGAAERVQRDGSEGSCRIHAGYMPVRRPNINDWEQNKTEHTMSYKRPDAFNWSNSKTRSLYAWRWEGDTRTDMKQWLLVR